MSNSDISLIVSLSRDVKRYAGEFSISNENQSELKALESQISFAERTKTIVQEIEEEMMEETKEKMVKETID